MGARVKEFEGTWEEIQTHNSELIGKRVRLTVFDGHADDPSDRRSTAQDLLNHAEGWAGDDFEECLKAVCESRSGF